MPPRLIRALVASVLPATLLAVGVGDGLLEPRRVLVREVQRLFHEVVGRLDAVLERRVGVGLAQQREAVAHADVVVVEARHVLERAPGALAAEAARAVGDGGRRRRAAASAPPRPRPRPRAAGRGRRCRNRTMSQPCFAFMFFVTKGNHSSFIIFMIGVAGVRD